MRTHDWLRAGQALSATCACGRPVQDATICHGCSDRLERALGDIPALVQDLEITRSRQSRTSGQGIGIVVRGAERPLPWDQRAAEATDLLRDTLSSWVQVVLDGGATRPRMLTGQSPRIAVMARFLLAHHERLRHHPDSPDAVDEIGHAVDQARRVTDRPPDRVYAGPCREEWAEQETENERGAFCCVASLYARAAKGFVVCPNCHAEHDVEARRDWLLVMAEDQLATATHLSAALSRLGYALAPGTIRAWASKGRLVAHGVNDRGHPLYRVGDVRELTVQQALSPRRTG